MLKSLVSGIRDKRTADEQPGLAYDSIAQEFHALQMSRLASFLGRNDNDLVKAGISGLRHDIMLPWYAPALKTVTATLMQDLGILGRVPAELQEEKTRGMNKDVQYRMARVPEASEQEGYTKSPLQRLVEAKGLDIETMKNMRIDSNGKLWIIEADLPLDGMKNLVDAVTGTTRADEGFQLIADALATSDPVECREGYLKKLPRETANYIRGKINHLLVLRTQKYEEMAREAY